MRTFALAIIIGALASTTALAQQRAPRPDKACTTGQVVELRRPFAKLSGHLYVLKIAQFEEFGNTNQKGNRSPTVLCENGKVLGPAHARSDEISQRGNGRFTHFTDAIYFSTSDNSDANTNGRRYTVAVPKKATNKRR